MHAYEQFKTTTYFSALDALRAFSVIGVIWHHVSGITDVPFFSQGFRGVDFFFAISGFLITTLLLREHERTGSISLRNFYIRRSFRIFPLYYAVLGLYCVLTFATMRGTEKAAEFWGNLPAFLTYTSNWFVNSSEANGEGVTFYFAWSLATEEQFYLFWAPALVGLLALTKRLWPGAALALVLVIASLVAESVRGESFLLTAIASLAPAILLGAASAFALHSPRTFPAVYRVAGNKAAAPVLAALLIALLAAEAPGIAIQVVMVATVVALSVREDTVLHPALRWRPLIFLGAISYGIYLMHLLAANAVRRVLDNEAGIDVFLATTALVTLMAYLSFRYFEKPLNKQARRFQRKKPSVASKEPATPSQFPAV